MPAHKNISGFPELLPWEQIVFNRMLDVAKTVFEMYGFMPLDTSCIERADILTKKGSDHEIYGMRRIADYSSDKEYDIGLRFDLTVPFARYVKNNFNNICFPYKRYQIGRVFRGERAQSGRYREFYQCDIDIVCTSSLSHYYELELLFIIDNILSKIAAGLDYAIYINNRKIILGLINSFNANTHGNEIKIITVIDKLDKVPMEILKNELLSFGLNNQEILLIERLNSINDNSSLLQELKSLSKNELYQDGLRELEDVFSLVKHLPNICINPLLARGLNYYTGIIYEVKIKKNTKLGSICGGGRYDNLIESNGNKLLGVGISIGLSRLFFGLLDMGLIEKCSTAIAQVLITMQNPQLVDYYQEIANLLRNSNIKTDLYYQPGSLASQIKYADKVGINLVIIADEGERIKQEVIVKNLFTGEQFVVSIFALVNKIFDIK